MDHEGRRPEDTGESAAEDPGAQRPAADDGAQGTPRTPPPATWAGREWGPDAEESSPESDGELDSLEGPEEEDLERLSEEDLDELGDEALEGELDDEELAEEELAEELEGDGDDGGAAAAAAARVDGGGGTGSEDTVEADTPALAEREAAREAALAGVRARAAEHAAKQGTGATATAPAPATGTDAPPADEEEQAPPPAAPPAPPAPEAEEKPPRRGLAARFVAGSLLIMVSMATATAVSLLVYLSDIARGLGGLASVKSGLAVPDPGKPQSILILGSDKRPDEQEIGARSDTAILLRVAASQITVMSIPRDLKVNIPGHGVDKFNAAYTYGGPKLTLEVVKQLTGLDNINHVVNVDFNGFADAVNAIDCVYVDVDRHYYHSNLGLAATERYSEIDVPAGYQRMCGLNALQYVRYRHDDNDLVRAARQQEFLREARQELPAKKLLSDRNNLIEILKKYVTSDIEDPTTLVSLGKLFLAARSAPVVQVHFPASLGGPDAAYVTTSEEAIKEAVRKFEGETPQPPAETEQSSGGGESKSKEGSGKKGKPAPVPVIDSSALGQQYAAKLVGTKTKSGKPMLDFPLYYPTKLAPDSTITDDSRAFPIDGPGNDVYHGYRIVVAMPTNGYTAYYGVSGTDWQDPPILANPDETKTIDGRDYLESWDGSQLRFVGWKTSRGSFWVDNTLLNALTPGQMFAIAQSMRKVTG